MRSIKCFYRFALFFLFCTLIVSTAEAKPRLTVRAFDNKAESGARVPASAINEMMTTELFDSGLFTLLEREKLDYIAEEQKLGMSGLVDESTAPKVGNIKGARYTMTGAITVYHYHVSGGYLHVPGIAGAGAAEKTAYVTLDIRVIDNETSEVVYSAAQQGEATREASGILTAYAGFAQGSYGGILATATRNSVEKHVAAMKQRSWEE